MEVQDASEASPSERNPMTKQPEAELVPYATDVTALPTAWNGSVGDTVEIDHPMLVWTREGWVTP